MRGKEIKTPWKGLVRLFRGMAFAHGMERSKALHLRKGRGFSASAGFPQQAGGTLTSSACLESGWVGLKVLWSKFRELVVSLYKLVPFLE